MFRTLALIVALALPATAGHASDLPGACPGCNLVLVTFDALRADHVGAFGYGKPTTPRIDAFAGDAAVFTDAMSQSGTTISSLPSLFTSKFPHSDGLLHARSQLGILPGKTLLAQQLQEAGWNTAAVVAHEYARGHYGFSAGFDSFDDDYGETELAAATAARVEAALKDLEPPFFLWVHLRQPHSPYESTDEDFVRFYEGAVPPVNVQNSSYDAVLGTARARGDWIGKYTFGAELREMSQEMLKQYRAKYDGNLRRGDAAFGRIMAKLDEQAAREKTVVVVASDHGESLGEHGIFDHNTLYWGGLHTPILVRSPGIEAGRRRWPVSNVDILPTVLRLLGQPVPGDLRGRDLLDGDRDDVPQVAEYANRRTIKLGRWKYMEKPPGSTGPALFDIEKDPDEEHNLVEAEPNRAAELASRLQAIEGRAPEVKDELRDKLRALGYLR